MNARGNVFLYVLIAVVLFAGLTYAIMQINQQNDPTAELDEGRAKIAANAVLAWVASAQNAVNNMDQVGTDADELVFLRPADTGFNTAPHIHKLFHPDGGGLALKPLPRDAMGPSVTNPANGFYIGRFNNIQWTPSATNDVIAAAYGVSQPVCAEINKKITGSATIPSVAPSIRTYFVNTSYHGAGNANFMIASCAACDERPALCVQEGTTSLYVYYALLVAR
jgi:hypothetical protein